MSIKADTESGDPVSPGKQDRRRLPADVAISLPRKLERALDHRIRRQILRSLLASSAPLSPADIQRQGLHGDYLGTISYHVKVLASAELVREVDSKPVRGAIQHFYVATIADEPLIPLALEQTEKLDQV